MRFGDGETQCGKFGQTRLKLGTFGVAQAFHQMIEILLQIGPPVADKRGFRQKLLAAFQGPAAQKRQGILQSQ